MMCEEKEEMKAPFSSSFETEGEGRSKEDSVPRNGLSATGCMGQDGMYSLLKRGTNPQSYCNVSSGVP